MQTCVVRGFVLYTNTFEFGDNLLFALTTRDDMESIGEKIFLTLSLPNTRPGRPRPGKHI